MRLKRAMSLKAYRRRRRRGAQLGDELGARPRRGRGGRGRPGRRRPQRHRGRPRPARRPRQREQRQQQRAERIQQRLWSEPVALGENIRIQAAEGYRGAFLELRPGLYLVAELTQTGMAGDDFGRKVRVQDVTSEIVRVTDKALDAIFPARRAQKRSQRDEARRRQELRRREQAQARREREARERREREARERAERERAARALPAPEQRQLPAPRQQLLPPGAARWLDDDSDDEDLAGCRPCEEVRR